jgi:hypothetical protein
MTTNGYAEHNKAFAKLVRRLGYAMVADDIREWHVPVYEQFRQSPDPDIYLRMRFGERINYRHRQFLTTLLRKGPEKIQAVAALEKYALEKLVKNLVKEKTQTDLVELPDFFPSGA